MKVAKWCYGILAAAMFLPIVTGCSSSDGPSPDMEWDIWPVVIYADVTDAVGNNLLDPDFEGNIVGETMTVEYEGDTYGVHWKTPWLSPTRTYVAQFDGILHHPANPFKPASAENPWILEIGELPGDDNYDVTLPLKYKDKTFNIRVVNNFKWVKGQPDKATEIYLDGMKYEGKRLSIVI